MPRGRPANTDQEILMLKQKVCIAALKIISESGEKGLSFRRLASDIDSSHTRVHRYFSDRGDVLQATRDYAYGEFSNALERPSIESDDAPLEAIRKTGEAYFRFAHSNPYAFQFLFELATQKRKLHTNNESMAWSVLRLPIKKAMDTGVLEGDVEVVAHVYWSFIHGITCLSLSSNIKPTVNLEDILSAASHALTRGFAASDK